MALSVQFPNHQLATGWDNLVGLTAFETILAGYASLDTLRPSAFPRTFGSYDPGVFQIRGNGLATTAGFPLATVTFDVLAFAQHRGLMDDYCAGGYHGLVTVRLETDDNGTFANFNAVMTLPKPNQMRNNGYAFLDCILRFSLRGAAA